MDKRIKTSIFMMRAISSLRNMSHKTTFNATRINNVRTLVSLTNKQQKVWWPCNAVQERLPTFFCTHLQTRSMSNESGGGFQRAPGQNAGEVNRGPPVDPKAKMGIAFTCTICNQRVARFFSRLSYERGVVIIKVTDADGCTSAKGSCLHLIADNLGWFEDDPVNIETLAARKGEIVQRVTVQPDCKLQPAQDAKKASGQGEEALVHQETDTTIEYFRQGDANIIVRSDDVRSENVRS